MILSPFLIFEYAKRLFGGNNGFGENFNFILLFDMLFGNLLSEKCWLSKLEIKLLIYLIVFANSQGVLNCKVNKELFMKLKISELYV